MRNLILLIFFSVALLATVWSRFQFETKTVCEGQESEKYISLYRRYNTIQIVLFFYLTLVKADAAFDCF